MAEPYTVDFPELVKPPAENYAATLANEGIPRDEITAKMLVMDILVQSMVNDVRDALPFRAPETFFADDIIFASNIGERPDAETVACINKAVKILRGEMEASSIWSDFDSQQEVAIQK